VKILQITSHYDEGGAARIAATIHKQLCAEGIESKVAYGRGTLVRDKYVIKFGKEYEIYISALLSRFLGINGWWNGSATGRLLRLIDEFQPDILHLHALHGYYVNFPKLWKYIYENHIPVVWTFHDCHAFPGNCGYFFECQRWKQGCGKCPELHNYPASQWFDFTKWMWKKKEEMFTSGDKLVVVTPSDWLTNIVKQSFFKKYPCMTIHNGIDVYETFYVRDKTDLRKKYGYSRDKKLVLGIAVGYKDPRKGVKYILQAAKDLGEEVCVILIGWDVDNNEMLSGISNVTLLPTISDRNILAEYYSMADVFVIPSLAENYATTVLESMACGTPVVGFCSGGIPEQLADDKGIVVDVGNQEAFTQAVKSVLYGKVKVKSGHVLAQSIKSENAVRKMVNEYIKLYNEILTKE